MPTSNVNNSLLFVSRLVGEEMQIQGLSTGLQETVGEPTGVRLASSESRCMKTISLSKKIVIGLCQSSDFIPNMIVNVFNIESNAWEFDV